MDSANSLEHLFAELERLELRVRMQIWRMRLSDPHRDQLQPFYISETEIESLLSDSPGSPFWSAMPLTEELQSQEQESLDRLSARITALRARAGEQGNALRLDELAEQLMLTRFDLDVILVCLAPEVDQRYSRLYAYLQDDLSRPAPTVDMVVNLLCTSLAERMIAWERLGPRAPLRQHRLLELLPLATSLDQPFSGRTLRLDDRVRRYLLDDDGLDQRLDLFADLCREPGAGPSPDTLPVQILDRLNPNPESQIVYFHGPVGVGKLAAAQALAFAKSSRLLVIHGQRLLELPLEVFNELARRSVREALLQPALLYWSDFDELLNEEHAARWQILRDLLRETSQATSMCVILSGERPWDAGDAFANASGRVQFTRLAFQLPDSSQRLKIWNACLAGEVHESALRQIASRFRLSAGQIHSAAESARNLAYARDPQRPVITEADLLAACRMQSGQKLASLAQKIDPVNVWEDLVLPDESKMQLRALYDQVRYRSRVLEEWGFAEKLSLGKGMHALFTGAPGTGKSMAAGILAGALDLDLYKIDLSTVVSKYIGETEKNLARIFAEASASNAILFFDEADALFGQRTDVKDSHDRYANLEVSYLLQKMDEYDGLVILASNLRQNIDRAFLRRLNFIIDFPPPGPADRLRIWQGIWPAIAPRSADIDFSFLAEQLELTGGNIRNIVLSAAYLAASEGQEIHMAHLCRAAEGEYKKIGKLPALSLQLAGNSRGLSP